MGVRGEVQLNGNFVSLLELITNQRFQSIREASFMSFPLAVVCGIFRSFTMIVDTGLYTKDKSRRSAVVGAILKI